MTSTVLPIVPQLSDNPLAQYTLDMLGLGQNKLPIDAVLREMEAIAADESIPIIGAIEGAIIQSLVMTRGGGSRRILDIGTAIGYSALWLARQLPEGGHITSIEIDEARAQRAREFIEKAGCTSKITIIVGDVFNILPTLTDEYDIILQDIIKHVYFGSDASLASRLLDMMLDILADDGVLLGDNVFCMGEVLHAADSDLPLQVAGIQVYNRLVAAHPALESIIIPVRDGLWISHKR